MSDVTKTTTSKLRSIGPDGQRICTKCGGPGPFGPCKKARDGLHSWCKACSAAAAAARYRANPAKAIAAHKEYEKTHLEERRIRQKQRYKENPTKGRRYAKKYRESHPEKTAASKRSYQQRTLELYMWRRAKRRSEEKGWPFDLEQSDIVIPEVCPLLGIPLSRETTNATKRNAPSLDRINPALGYTKGNVWVISLKANTMKSDASLAEIELLAANLRKKINSKG